MPILKDLGSEAIKCIIINKEKLDSQPHYLYICGQCFVSLYRDPGFSSGGIRITICQPIERR